MVLVNVEPEISTTGLSLSPSFCYFPPPELLINYNRLGSCVCTEEVAISGFVPPTRIK